MSRLRHLLLAVACLAGCGGGSSPEAPLDWALGRWEGTRRAAADGSEAPLRLLVEKLPGGPGQLERLEVETDGEPYVGFTVRAPDPATGRWTMLYANDVRPRVARLDATFEGDRIVWLSRTAKPPRGSRLVAERLGPDHWRRTQQVTDDGGATWRILFVDELRRVVATSGDDL